MSQRIITGNAGHDDNSRESNHPHRIPQRHAHSTSYGKWLHPLFELEEYLAEHPIQPENLILQDKIIGKAAALLIHRLGFRIVKAGVLSRLGEAVLQRHGIAYTYEQLADRIHCQTEELLADVGDPEEAYRLVKVRAGR